MQYDELIGKVQAEAQLPDRGAAERTARAVLHTLAERMPDGLARHMAAQLPEELAESVREGAAEPAGTVPAGPSVGERFGLTTFAGRVAWRADLSEEDAVRHAAAVLEVLDAAVPEEMEKVAQTLPPDIRELLPSGRAAEGG